MMVVAMLGTTISPYLFFWQAAQEVEDTKEKPERTAAAPGARTSAGALARIQSDTLSAWRSQIWSPWQSW